MPRSRYSAKDERMVDHIRVSAKKQGHSAKRAEQIAWATTNKFKNKKLRKDILGMAPGGTMSVPVGDTWAEKKQEARNKIAMDKPHVAKPTANMGDDVAAAQERAGRVAPQGQTPQRQPVAAMPRPTPVAAGGGAPKAPAVAMKGKDMKVKKDLPAGDAYAAMGKAVRVVSIDEALDDMRARVGAPTRKALSTGYGRTSGGGALKAPNRGYPRGARTEAQRPIDLSVGDLERAMVAQPPPSPAGHQKKPVYLPGVHPTDSPLRAPKRLSPKKSANDKQGKLKKMVPTISASAAKVNEEGGATELSNSITEAPTLKKPQIVVHKSEGDPTMSKMDFNDLFKSELGAVAGGDEVLIECPHCEHPITKSEALEKARGHKGKGKVTHQTGPKTSSAPHVADQNPAGGTMRGGEGRGVLSPDRGVPGAKKTDAVVGVQNGKGSKASKAMDDDSSSDDGSSSKKSGKPSMTMSYSKDEQDKRDGAEPVKKGIIIRGTDQVQYIEDNFSPTGDAAIAKAIAEGRLGGTPPTQPLDLNNDLTRLLV